MLPTGFDDTWDGMITPRKFVKTYFTAVRLLTNNALALCKLKWRRKHPFSYQSAILSYWDFWKHELWERLWLQRESNWKSTVGSGTTLSHKSASFEQLHRLSRLIFWLSLIDCSILKADKCHLGELHLTRRWWKRGKARHNGWRELLIDAQGEGGAHWEGSA